ncbi:unnamed protein product [Danaus chrysippus]|uniref:(African queen) hypothetical protein n=1 Tax=Danaus chrysippus TaxID=151541 RepID=A0A8J2WF01_9NEOP|nr:unnamed protein product [Danaus chrysippus]
MEEMITMTYVEYTEHVLKLLYMHSLHRHDYKNKSHIITSYIWARQACTAREAHTIPSTFQFTYPTQPTRPIRLTTSTCLTRPKGPTRPRRPTRPNRAISPTPPNVTSNKDTAKHNKGNFKTNVPLVRGQALHPPRQRPLHVKLSVCR